MTGYEWWQRIALCLCVLALAVMATVAAWSKGHSMGYTAHEKEVRDAALQGAKDAADRKAENAQTETKTITEYVEVERVVTVKGDTIIKEVPVYVTQKSDAACTVPLGFVSLYDRAILAGQDGQKDTPGHTDASAPSPAPAVPAADWTDLPSGVPLSQVASTAVENTTAYHQLAARFSALNEWIDTQCYAPE